MSTSGVGYEQLNAPLKAMINAGGGGNAGGAGGSFVVAPRFSTVKLVSDSSKVDIQIGDFDKDFDTLLVFKNSVYIGQGIAYNVISNTQIQSIDNSNWVAGTTFQFVCLHVNRAPSVLKCISIKNKVTLTTNSTFIDIGVRGFDKDADTLLLFENGVYMEKDIDYRIDGSKIYPVGDTMYRGTTTCPLIFNIIVLRNIIDPEAVKDFEGSNIKDLSITMNKLAQDIQNILKNPQDKRVGNMSLLKTTAKDTLVNSINELFQCGTQTKQIATTALSANNISYSSSDGIPKLVQTMADNMGGLITLSDIFDKRRDGTVIDPTIDSIVIETGGYRGNHWYSGDVPYGHYIIKDALDYKIGKGNYTLDESNSSYNTLNLNKSKIKIVSVDIFDTAGLSGEYVISYRVLLLKNCFIRDKGSGFFEKIHPYNYDGLSNINFYEDIPTNNDDRVYYMNYNKNIFKSNSFRMAKFDSNDPWVGRFAKIRFKRI